MTSDNTHIQPALALAGTALLSACGGGDDQDLADKTSGRATAQAVGPISNKNAYRFLAQASMGPTMDDAAVVQAKGYDEWLTDQFALPRAEADTYDYQFCTSAGLRTSNVPIPAPNPDQELGQGRVLYGNSFFTRTETVMARWWKGALRENDQLRQRVVLALSEILVISDAAMSDLSDGGRGLAAYLDLLNEHAFGNYRTLIEAVAKNPAMGYFLTHLGNRKQPNESAPGTGRIPDQNFARELLQLFTLGLSKLNPDGTEILVNGKPVPTMGRDDVATLSHVFTGWAMNNDSSLAKSYDGTVTIPGSFKKADGTNPAVSSMTVAFGSLPYNATDWRWTVPMSANADEHAKTAELPGDKKLLGSTLVLGTPQVSMDNALTIIFAHQNLAPFIARQFIQRLVTSNPSPAYVLDVATAFKNANWSMQALIRATLLHTEARTAPTSTSYGKVREPLLRLTHLMRVYGARSYAPVGNALFVSPPTGDMYATRAARVGSRTIGGYSLGQTPLHARSVFNFFLATYKLPATFGAAAGLSAPEMQVVDDATVPGYVNAIHDVLDQGLFSVFGTVMPIDVSDERTAVLPSDTPESAASKLAGRINFKLFGNAMSPQLKAAVTNVCQQVLANNMGNVDGATKAGILFAMVSSDYLIQK